MKWLLNFKIFISAVFFSCQALGQTLVTGQLLDEASKTPIEFATVATIDPQTNLPLEGTTTDDKGFFSLETNAGIFEVEISFIGYEKHRIKNIVVRNNTAKLGTILLKADSKQLEQVIIEGERSSTEFKIDKRIFNVGQDLTSAGGSALDVLNNVPSVTVNIEGQIALRGSTGVQILIDGKPSVLTSGDAGNSLGSITADMIDQIEVITNPSAKYQAEGTSGIINIVLKKEEKRGTNGSVSFNTGMPHNHSVGLSLNHRTEKFNLFSQVGAGYREIPDFSRSENRNLVARSTIKSDGIQFRNEQFYNLILGADYIINPQNIITLSGNYALEIEDQPSTTDYELRNDITGQNTAEWQRRESTGALNPKYQFDLQYKRDFKDHEDHDLIASVTGSYFAKDQTSDFRNITFLGVVNQADKQRTATNFGEQTFTYKLDYTKPISKKFKIETGAQYLLNDVDNDFSVENLINEAWVLDTTQTNLFKFSQNVLGVYTTAAYEKSRWGIKLGLRVEHTDLNTLLQNTEQRNTQDYSNLFPTVHTSYKMSDRLSAQAGYSRRIYRPDLWDLNPFFNIRDNFNIRQGNPSLLPEFTDSYETGLLYNARKVSINSALYYRLTTSVIEQISVFENNVNIRRPDNIGTNQSTGLEVNTKYDPYRWLSFNGDFNYNYFYRTGSFSNVNFDFSANQWSSRLNTKVQLPYGFDVELTGNYQSSYRTLQGEMLEMAFMDIGARKKIMKGKGVINFSIRDVFRSRIERIVVDQNTFNLFDRSLRGRFITFGFSYGFGKGEAMVYSGGRRR